MIASEFTDKDGFKLQFDETCSEADKKFFREQYLKVDLVAKQKLHCTTCDVHIGTAPISEKIIRTHQILGVTQCNKCFAFYNSGEFGKGEDGSEYYCRWCGQGGEVFCCSTCPFVFCNKCIRANLTNAYVKEIEETDDWSCFVCDKSILQKHRGHHWALRNFMNKQLEKIQKINITSEDDLNNLLNEDISECCPRRKRKSLVKPAVAPVKRPSMNGGMWSAQPPAKKINLQQPPARQIRAPQPAGFRPQQAPAKAGPPGKKNDEIVCTPDIMGLFNDHSDNGGNPQMPASSSMAVPPLVMRNNQRPVRPQAPAPIYHNVNGFQIDLNHAARQEIFRLPNGKLIQVRKQTGPNPTQPPLRPGMPLAPPPRGPQFTIRQAGPSARATYQPRAAPQVRPRFNSQPQTRFTFSDGRVVAQPTPTPPAAPTPSASTVFTQQNGSISVARAPQPNTPFGVAKTEFEDKIISGMEICQHTINKMITLTNSSSFKTSANFKDLKDLYIHLQYLFTYTSGKFQTLQDNLKTGMESLAKHDVNLKDKADDDELEIVEEKQDVIEVMSDDDEPPAKKDDEKAATPVVKKPLLKHIQYTKEGTTPEAASTPSVARVETTKHVITPETAEIIGHDKKLQNKVLVKVEKLENAKNPIIKQYLSKLQERMEMQMDESRESTPDNLFEPMVMIDEGDDAIEMAPEKDPAVEQDKEKSESQKTVEAPKIVDVVELDDDDDVVETTPTVEKPELEAEKPAEDESKEAKSAEDDTEKPESSEADAEKSPEAEKCESKKEEPKEAPEESKESSEVSKETSEESIETPEESKEVPEESNEDSEKSKEESEKPPEEEIETINIDDSLQDITEKTDLLEKIADDTVESLSESHEVIEVPSDLTENSVEEVEPAEDPSEAPETVTGNGFFDCATNGSNLDAAELTDLGDKTVDDLPTIDEVSKIVAAQIDDDAAILEDLLNGLENKSTTMEVD